MKIRNRLLTPSLLLLALVAISGCKKKQAAVPNQAEAPPQAAPAPTAELNATPSVISAGDQVQLSWHTTNATNISIDGIGDVPSSGVKTVTPAQTVTYHLVARNDSGSADATASVTVNAPIGVAVPSTGMSEEQDFNAHVQPVFFDYDTYDIRPDGQSTLSKDADWLISHPNVKVVIGGYCDERGSDEYNLVLAQNRAQAAKAALQTAGVAANRMRIISYGKEKPFCTQSTEECWQLNRRDGFAIDK